LRTIAQAASELTKISPATAITVISRLIENASGVLVRSQAARKFPQCIGQGKLKPVPAPVWAGDFSAMATAKYSGMMTIREMSAMTIVSPQLTRPPSGMGRGRRVLVRGAAAAGGVVTWVAIYRLPPRRRMTLSWKSARNSVMMKKMTALAIW
jgi:hypothetical protein